MKRISFLIIGVLVVGCNYNFDDYFGAVDGGGGARGSSSANTASSSSSDTSATSTSSASAGTSSASTSASVAASSSSSGGGFYWKSGVQLSVPKADMTGWTECYSGLYADTMVPMQQILDGCPGGKLALGCRLKGSATFQVLAMGDRSDATFVFPDADNTGTHVANGVGWYMSGNNWGFVQGGDPLWKGPMDVMGISPNSPGPNGDKRVSWVGSLGELFVGYRCGYDCNSNHPGFDYNYQRVVLSAP